MLDMKFVRENPELVKENIKKKFQDEKLPLVDQVIELDERRRAAMTKADELRANRNKLSKEIGALMAQGKKEEGMALRQKVADQAKELEELTKEANQLNEQVTKIMMTIPNIIDPSVPIGKDDSENVEVERFGEPVVPDFEVPYHTDIMERFDGIDLDAARSHGAHLSGTPAAYADCLPGSDPDLAGRSAAADRETRHRYPHQSPGHFSVFPQSAAALWSR